MLDLLYIEEIEQANALLQPLRVELLKQMVEPRTCTELAEVVQQTPQRVYYHVKILEKAGLVEKASERKVRGIQEGLYQAKARSYWLSPQLVGRLGGQRQVTEQMSLGFLLSLAEELQADIGALAPQTEAEIPSLGLSAQVELKDEADRAEFMADVQEMFQELAQKYGRRDEEAGDSHLFRLMLACYPKPERGA
jgi:DNA-binding transcriptional ArsR family regulator